MALTMQDFAIAKQNTNVETQNFASLQVLINTILN